MTGLLKKLAEFKFILLIFLIMISVMSFGDLLPLVLKRGAYTFSTLIRAGLMFLLPLLVLPFVVSSIALLRSNGLILIVSLVFLITASNFLSIMIGGQVASAVVPLMNFGMTFNAGDAQELLGWFDITLEPLLSVEVILLLGFALGFLLSLLPSDHSLGNRTLKFFESYKKISTLFFQKIFIPLLPFYIFGMLLKLDAENDFATVFKDFGNLILVIVAVQFSYIFFIFWVGNKYSLRKVIQCYKNVIPAGLLGFSTMSSLVTMPVTLETAEKNLGDKAIAQVAITSTVNCHDIGECISLSVIASAVYLMANGMIMPDFWTFTQFAFILAVAQFTGVSVPGGSVVIIIPLLTKYLGFSPEMIGLVTTIAIFMDPIGTANNVVGNSAFALIIQRYFNLIKGKLGNGERPQAAKF